MKKYLKISLIVVISLLYLGITLKKPQEQLTEEQINVIVDLDSYLSKSNVSEKKLYTLVQQRGYTNNTFALSYLKNHQYINWNERAYQTALHYLDLGCYDKESLYQRLKDGEQFTSDQALYAVTKCNL